MSTIPEKPLEQREIYLKDIHGQLFLATIELDCLDWNENGRRRTECRIILRWLDNEIDCVDWNFFESLKRVREHLAVQNLCLMCYGASRNIVVTGMLINMGLGMKVYKGAQLGEFPRLNQLVNLFASGEDVEPISVEGQEKFQREWATSVLAAK